MKGFRQQAESSRKERLRSMETELKNSQMASRISQMMTQQIMQNMQNMQQDLGRALGLINEMQYKVLAVQKVANLDLTELNAIAAQLRLNDFNEASDREDAENGFTVGVEVNDSSTVILTSKTDNGPDGGIFRSRIELSKCGVPDLIKAFMGREAGAKAIVKLNGVDHEIELLGVRQPPATVETTPVQDAVQPIADNAASAGEVQGQT